MSIVFPCDCGSRLQVPDHRAGQTIRCPSCGGQTQVPRLGEDPFSYSVEGATTGEAGWALTAEDRARSQATKPLPKSTYQSARTSQAAEDETVPRGRPSRARARRKRQPGWSASFWFPFQQENKFAFVAWAIGFVFFALMMSVPVISMRLYVGRIFLLLFAADLTLNNELTIETDFTQSGQKLGEPHLAFSDGNFLPEFHRIGGIEAVFYMNVLHVVAKDIQSVNGITLAV